MAKRRATVRSPIGFAVPALAAVLLAVAGVLLAPVLPLQDFNEWIYQGAVLRDLMSGHATPFTLKPWPVPNALAQFLLGVLTFAVSPLRAGQAFILAYVIGFAALCWRICRRGAGTDYVAFALMVPMLVLNADFWSGELNLQLGLLLLAAHLLLVRGGRELRWWQEALIAVLMFFTHAAAFAALAVHIGWRAWQRRGPVRGTLRAIAVLLPALVLVAWHSRAAQETVAQQPGDIAGFLAAKAYRLIAYGPYQNMAFAGQGDWQLHPGLYWAGSGLNVLFALVTIPGLLMAALGGLRSRGNFPELMTALTCFVAFLALPESVFGVAHAGAHFLVPALLFALSATEDWRGLRRYGAMLAAATPLMLLYVGFLQAQPANSREADQSDPGRRTNLLFLHRPWAFRDAALAAQAGNHARRLGLTDGMLAPR